MAELLVCLTFRPVPLLSLMLMSEGVNVKTVFYVCIPIWTTLTKTLISAHTH